MKCPSLSKTSPLAPHWRVQVFPHHHGAELDHSCRRQKIIKKNKMIPLGNIMCNGRDWDKPPEPHMEALRAPTQAALYPQFPGSQLGFSQSFSLLNWIPCPALPCNLSGSQMLVEVLGSCLGAGWAKRAEERGDGECGKQGWVGDALLGLAQPQPCCPPPSPANVTPSARSTSPTMVPIKEKKPSRAASKLGRAPFAAEDARSCPQDGRGVPPRHPVPHSCLLT